MYESVLQQIALEIYPQRKTDKPGFIEKLGRRIFRDPFQNLKNNRLLFSTFVHLARKELIKVDALDEQQWRSEIDQLRFQFRSKGLKPRLVARCFALVSAVAKKELGMSHQDNQLLGGWAMLNGMIAEMKPGEGKTLMATLPACTAALAGIPVHIITLNDYLASRDAEWMAPVYEALGLTVGVINSNMEPEQRREAYHCDISYCINKQLAFDHLRDRLILKKYSGQLALRLAMINKTDAFQEDFMLPGLCFAIVDEADSVLIDETITPLVVSRSIDTSSKREVLEYALTLARQLDELTDYEVDKIGQDIKLSSSGSARLAELSKNSKGLWRNSRYREDLVVRALKAELLFDRDQQYRVQDRCIEISDASNPSLDQGMLQMIEVKEGCEISGEQETLGRISYQRLFQRYLMLGGMSGNIRELADELKSVYQLSVMPISLSVKSRTRRYPPRIVQTRKEKWQAIVERVREFNQQGRPVLIGTRAVSDSALLGQKLDDAGISNSILTAAQDAEEARSLALAGQAGRVTIATDLSGRGTDIKLDHTAEELDGLHVILAERHESGRKDRQFYEQCGRRGYPGSYESITSMEDELVLHFTPNWSLTVADILWKNSPILARLLSLYLTRRAQKSAEKKQRYARRMVLRSEDYLDNVLAFTGIRE